MDDVTSRLDPLPAVHHPRSRDTPSVVIFAHAHTHRPYNRTLALKILQIGLFAWLSGQVADFLESPREIQNASEP